MEPPEKPPVAPGPRISYYTGSTSTSLCIDSPVINTAPIDDPRARDTVMLTSAVTISSIVILLLQLSLKVVGPTVCSRLTSYLKAPTALVSYTKDRYH